MDSLDGAVNHVANAALIAAAPSMHAELLALRAERDRLRAFVEKYVARFGARYADETDSEMVTVARAALSQKGE